MNNEIIQFFGLIKPFYHVPFLETETIKKQVENIKAASRIGCIIVKQRFCGKFSNSSLMKNKW